MPFQFGKLAIRTASKSCNPNWIPGFHQCNSSSGTCNGTCNGTCTRKEAWYMQWLIVVVAVVYSLVEPFCAKQFWWAFRAYSSLVELSIFCTAIPLICLQPGCHVSQDWPLSIVRGTNKTKSAHDPISQMQMTRHLLVNLEKVGEQDTVFF